MIFEYLKPLIRGGEMKEVDAAPEVLLFDFFKGIFQGWYDTSTTFIFIHP